MLANSTDPLFQFQVARPINNKDAKIYGFEIAGQYFLGNTGFGVAAAYTMVRGDVGFDIGAEPSEDQFALLGLSDTFNVTLIYEKYGISARLAYNWRDKFLSGINRGGRATRCSSAPFGQLDLNISYDVTKNISVTLEGINLTEESVRTYARDENRAVVRAGTRPALPAGRALQVLNRERLPIRKGPLFAAALFP